MLAMPGIQPAKRSVNESRQGATRRAREYPQERDCQQLPFSGGQAFGQQRQPIAAKEC
jgi:hypothetical protein